MNPIDVADANGVLSFVGLLLWAVTTWRIRYYIRYAKPSPPPIRDAAIVSLLIVTFSTMLTSFLVGRDSLWLIDIILLTACSALVASGVVAFMATRRIDP